VFWTFASIAWPCVLVPNFGWAVKEVDVLVRCVFSIFIFDIDGYGPEHDIGYLHYVNEFFFISKTTILQPPQLATQ
jgi:hypothetical protein